MTIMMRLMRLMRLRMRIIIIIYFKIIYADILSGFTKCDRTIHIIQTYQQ